MSIYEDPATWRLRTAPAPFGIPYKLVEGYPKGSFEEENAKITEQYIIQASDLLDFALESFPPMIIWGGIFHFTATRAYPGLNRLFTKSVSWEPHEVGKPTDPFGTDPFPPTGTYAKFLKVTIQYETAKPNNTDPNDPSTFLEVSADASGEFLMLQVQGEATWESMAGPKVQGPNTQVAQVIPELTWSVRWPQITRSYLDELMPLMRSRLGQVNSRPMSILHDAPAETILFVGYSMREQYTWRTDEDQPPVEIDMKFVEKHIEIAGVTVGHNHFWQPELNRFAKLQVGGKGVYPSSDLNQLFPGG